ncbi:hypothetical protein H6P81_017647 [Aristolochia fimbriata]|uniref:Uncharacterized protein n=1 Tax=Aristolochia fimbriata TaxID=158543 RepID=A0AAV7DZH7_ARIFI|nr:hypothetical protein H6P81_017647 [Aristolochia fimbriata]
MGDMVVMDIKKFVESAFIEMRTVEEATNAMALYGILFMAARHAPCVYVAGDMVVIDIKIFAESALIEMRTVEEATNAMALDGILFMVLK